MKTQSVISEELTKRFTAFLEKATGLYFRKENWPLFTRKFKPAVEEFGFNDPVNCMEWLMEAHLNEEQIAVLARHLTVGETYFFRDTNAFHTLRNCILPEIIERKRNGDRQIRIWSAACCTGEEPYSIAILLKMILPDIHDWSISILGTDINPHFLRLAKQGEFREWSFRGTPNPLKQQFFKPAKKDKYIIDPEIRNMVRFRYLNLVEDSYPSLLNNTNAMDLILCNNVLIYFAEPTINQVVNKLSHALLREGWLMASPVEAPYIRHRDLNPTTVMDTFTFRKGVSKTEIKAKPIPPTIEVVLPGFINPGGQVLKFDFNQTSAIPQKPAKEPKQAASPYSTKEKASGLGVATAHYDRGEYAEAIATLLQEPETAESATLLSKCYGNIGNLEQALETCQRAIGLSKVNPMVYFLNATILQELDKNNEAIETLQKSIYLDPSFIIAHMTLGNLLVRSGKPQEGKRHFRNALTLLEKCSETEIVPCSEGLPAGRLREIIATMQGVQNG